MGRLPPENGEQKLLGAASHVPGAHRGGERESGDPPECLHLQGADKGDGRVGEEVGQGGWKQMDAQEQDALRQEDASVPRRPASARSI